MGALRISTIVVLFASAGALFAQSTNGERGSIPPGSSQDGSRPSDGAIKGGAILPGETGGMPNAGVNRPAEEDVNRCRQLAGTLREQCLRDLGAATGSTRAPESSPLPPLGRDPVTAPPPQNPR